MAVPKAALTFDPDTATGDERFRMTYPEFDAWCDQDAGRRGEWVDGEAIPFGRTTYHAASVTTFVLTLFYNVVAERRLGTVIGGGYQFQTRYGALRSPDLLVVLDEHRAWLTEDRLVGPADAVVEIVAPDSVARDRRDKIAEYAEAGVPEYWIIDPRSGKEVIDLYHLDEDRIYVGVRPDDEGRLWSRTVPGLWLERAWLVIEEFPKVLGLARSMIVDS